MPDKQNDAREEAYEKALLIASEGDLPPDRAVAIAIDLGWNAHAAAVADEPDEAGLLPCPFCGGKMSITEDAGGPFRDHNKVAFIAGCDNEECDLQFPGCDTKKLAMEIANRRVK